MDEVAEFSYHCYSSKYTKVILKEDNPVNTVLLGFVMKRNLHLLPYVILHSVPPIKIYHQSFETKKNLRS